MNTKNIFIIIAVIVIAVLGFWFLSRSTQHESLTETPQSPAERNFTVVIENQKIVSGPTTLSANRGDLITITVTADEEEEFHVHGYDVSVDLAEGVPSTLTFLAENAGRFMFELEEKKIEIGAIEINP